MFREVFGGAALVHFTSALPIYPAEDPVLMVPLEAATALFVISIVIISLVTFLVAVAATVILMKMRLRNRDANNSKEEDNQAYLELNLEEQELYFQSKEYIATNPYFRGDLTLSQNLLIQEKGVRAWEFVRDGMLTANDLLIVNKYELNFFKNFECSTQTNLPIPSTNEVYYFESKIYLLPNPEETTISIGLGIKPYPWFRLPGRHAHSISYDSDGFRRHNQPFKFLNEPPFPQLIEGDVVGIGYRVRSGTVFFTRNGKKLSELKIGGHIKNFRVPLQGQLFPIIGANNLCSVHVNVGQLGYVFIEGNVKKWGFAPLEGSGPAPPAYQKFNADILLERSEIDDENDLADRVNDFPPDFWDLAAGRRDDLLELGKFSYSAFNEASDDERITMNSLLPHEPPQYDYDSLIEDDADYTGEGRVPLTVGPTELNPDDAQLRNQLRDVEHTDTSAGKIDDGQPEEFPDSQVGGDGANVSAGIQTGGETPQTGDSLQSGDAPQTGDVPQQSGHTQRGDAVQAEDALSGDSLAINGSPQIDDAMLNTAEAGSVFQVKIPGANESPTEIQSELDSPTDDQTSAFPVDSHAEGEIEP